MKKSRFLILLTLNVAILSACGGGVSDGEDGIDGKDGIDGVAGLDGVDGAPGLDGEDGLDGGNGLETLVTVSLELAGSNCNQGGQKIESGLDANRNNTLDPSEVENVSFLCGDITPPSISQVNPVVSPAHSFTPNFTFSSNEAGRIIYNGECASDTASATIGNNLIKFLPLSNGVYSDCSIQVEDAAGNMSTELVINTFTIEWMTKPLNDTGVTKCGDFAFTEATGIFAVAGSGVHNNNLDCSIQPGIPTQNRNGSDPDGDIIRGGQDSLYGRDVFLYDNADGHAGFNFTKLDSDGLPLVDQAQDYATNPWSCVKDNVTGLIWEVKTVDGLQSSSNTYSWYNSTGINDGGNPGLENGGTCSGGTGCDTEKYVNDVNAANSGEGICGANDWRVPTKQEAMSINNFGSTNPSMDAVYFPNTQGTYHWTSSSWSANTILAWNIFYGGGNIVQKNKNDGFRVRLVRGGP